MATLRTIVNGVLADAEDLNFNFNALNNDVSNTQNNINSVNSFLSAQINNTKSSLENSQEALKTELNQSITNVTSTANSKAKKDLSDASPTAAFKNNTIDWLSPNYGAGYSVSPNWTAPKAGWVYCEMNSSANGTTKVLIGGKAVAYNYQGAGDGRAGALKVGCLAFIAKGQALTTSVTGSPTNSFVFYPCKGN